MVFGTCCGFLEVLPNLLYHTITCFMANLARAMQMSYKTGRRGSIQANEWPSLAFTYIYTINRRLYTYLGGFNGESGIHDLGGAQLSALPRSRWRHCWRRTLHPMHVCPKLQVQSNRWGGIQALVR